MNGQLQEDIFGQAVFLHQEGRLAEAEALYRGLLSGNPNHSEALHHLGILAEQAGQSEAAVDLIGRALELQPQSATAHNNLAVALLSLGRFAECAEACQRALSLAPDFYDACCILGKALREQGELAGCIDAFSSAVALRPDIAETHNLLACALAESRQFERAIESCRRAIAMRADYPEAHNNLGNALAEHGRLEEAIAAYSQAIALHPGFPEAHGNFGSALIGVGRAEEAAAACRRAIALDPAYAEAHNNLGNALKALGQPDAAEAAYREAVALSPGFPDAQNNIGNAFKDQGRVLEALAAYRKALEFKPGYVEAYDNLLFTMHYLPGVEAAELALEHSHWAERHALPLERFQRVHENSPDPQRRLRVGYVSADLRGHPVGVFLLPLLEGHDRSAVEVFAYSSGVVSDGWTERLRGCCDHWRRLVGVSDEAAAELIRGDGIDVLVDLSLHTAGNRLPVFARRPAPVQVSYLGYVGSTGMRAMDYRLSDRFLDPEGGDMEGLYSEETVRLPGSYWCYRPWTEREVNPLPARESGVVTFGSLNAFCKVNAELLAWWGRVLLAVPGSRLLLHAPEGSARERVLDELGQAGVERGRVEFVGRGSPEDYFARYGRVDIALDPHPYGGGTTTCDALWMGVPVVSLIGRLPVGRAGLSILSHAGHPEWVAGSWEDYVQIAASLAGDLGRLAEVRAGLRAQLRGSALMDEAGFVRGVEGAYRAMWRRWCPGSESIASAASMESTQSRGGVCP